MLHLVRCRHTKVLWKNCLKFCHKVLEAPDMTDRPERAVIFNQDKETNMLPEAARAFIRHAFNIFYHDFANVEKGHIFVWQKVYYTEPSQPFEGRRCDTRGKSDYNTPTGYIPTLQRRFRRRAEKNSST